MWENLKISVGTKENKVDFDAVRFSAMFDLESDTGTKVASVCSPVLDSKSNINFESGSLYRTLPLDNNKISIPIINAPFETNSGRDEVDDNSLNEPIIEFVWRFTEGILKIS